MYHRIFKKLLLWDLLFILPLFTSELLPLQQPKGEMLPQPVFVCCCLSTLDSVCATERRDFSMSAINSHSPFPLILPQQANT